MRNEAERLRFPAAGRFGIRSFSWRVLLMLLLLAVPARPTLAEETAEVKTGCSLRIRYFDDAEENGGNAGPVAGAVFTVWRIAVPDGPDGFTRPLIAGMEVDGKTDAGAVAEQVRDAYARALPEGGAVYELTTGPEGTASCEKMPYGVYLVCETKAAPKHYPSAPFLIMLPGTSEDGTMPEYDRTAEPKPLSAGDLLIRKNVGGNAGDKNREFHFTVDFDYAGTFQMPEPWECTGSGGKKGTIRSGDTFVLRSGETMLIENIPAGAKYTVTEKEAGQDGYQTESTGAEGVIRRTSRAEAVFTNTKNAPSAGGKSNPNIQTGDSFLVLLGAAGLLGAFVLNEALRGRRKGGEK